MMMTMMTMTMTMMMMMMVVVFSFVVVFVSGFDPMVKIRHEKKNPSPLFFFCCFMGTFFGFHKTSLTKHLGAKNCDAKFGPPRGEEPPNSKKGVCMFGFWRIHNPIIGSMGGTVYFTYIYPIKNQPSM